NSPEIGLSLLDEKSEIRKAKVRTVVGALPYFSATPWLPCVGLELLAKYWKAHLLHALTVERAPPHVINLRSDTRTISTVLSSRSKIQVIPSSFDAWRAGTHQTKPFQAEYSAFVGVGINIYVRDL